MTQRPDGLEEEPAFITLPPSDVLARLLPDATTLRLDACAVDEAAAQITLAVQSTHTSVSCPLCATLARRLHSDDTRTLAALPWAQYHVRLQLRVRQWFCRNRSCPRRIFTERLPTIAAPGARRTLRLVQRLVALSVALGGNAGGRLGYAWDVRVSRSTLLRRLRGQPAPEAPTPKVLGVDDWALRTGHIYGTILVDLERRQPIALLPDRTAAPVAQWLREHPGVEVIARDRARAYAAGATQGAPQAMQVADRFHRLHNLREALDAVCTTHHQALNAVNATQRPQLVPLPEGTSAVPVPPPPTPPQAAPQAAQRAAARQARYDEVWRLHRQGWPITAIAPQVGRRCRTIERSLQMPPWPAPPHRRHYGRSVLNPEKDVLLERWNAGGRTAIQLFRELQAHGYPGS